MDRKPVTWTWVPADQDFPNTPGRCLRVSRTIIRYTNGMWGNRVIYSVVFSGVKQFSFLREGTNAEMHRQYIEKICSANNLQHVVVLHHKSQVIGPAPLESIDIHKVRSYPETRWDMTLSARKGQQVIDIRTSGPINELLKQALEYGSWPYIVVHGRNDKIVVERTLDAITMFLLGDYDHI